MVIKFLFSLYEVCPTFTFLSFFILNLPLYLFKSIIQNFTNFISLSLKCLCSSFLHFLNSAHYLIVVWQDVICIFGVHVDIPPSIDNFLLSFIIYLLLLSIHSSCTLIILLLVMMRLYCIIVIVIFILSVNYRTFTV